MKFAARFAFPLWAVLLIPAYLLLLMLPAGVARWCDANLVSGSIPRPAMEGQLSEQAQDSPVAYGLYRKRILSGSESDMNVSETDAEALACSLADTLRELETAGVLPDACLAEADTIRDLPDAIAYIGREDGFVQKSYLGHVQTQTGPSKSIVIQQQEETGLVVACTMDAEGSADASALLSAYRSYLGLDGLTDWQTLQTETGAACWSCEGQLYLYCSFGGGRFSLGAVSMDEETLKAVAAGLS